MTHMYPTKEWLLLETTGGILKTDVKRMPIATGEQNSDPRRGAPICLVMVGPTYETMFYIYVGYILQTADVRQAATGTAVAAMGR